MPISIIIPGMSPGKGGGKDPVLEKLEVTENGTYTPEAGIDGYNEVAVDVQPALQLKVINENGEYYPDEGYDGFEAVAVDVLPELEDITITENGTYTPEAYGFSQVNVDVPQEGTDYLAEKLKGTLTSYNIPSEVTLIASYGFAYCESLSRITIPSLLTSIGEGAFKQCNNLSQISIPSTVTYIDSAAFAACGITDLSWPSGITDIRNNTFESCSMLLQIYIPSTVSTFGYRVFRDCTSLSSIVFESGISIYQLGQNMFDNCSNLYSISIPEGYTGENDPQNIFTGSFLHNITLPSTTTRLGYWTFHQAYGLETLTVYASTPPITNTDLFNDNPMLKAVKVPYEVVNDYKVANYWSDWSNIIKPISIPSGVSCNLNFNLMDCELVSPVSQYTLGDSLDIEITTNVSGYAVPGTIDVSGSDDYEYSVSGNIGTIIINHATDIDIVITGIASMPLPEGFDDFELIPYIEVGNVNKDNMCTNRIKCFNTGILPSDTDSYEIVESGLLNGTGGNIALVANDGWRTDSFMLWINENRTRINWSQEYNDTVINPDALHVVLFNKDSFVLDGVDISLQDAVVYTYDTPLIIGNTQNDTHNCNTDGYYRFNRFKVTDLNDEVTHLLLPAHDKKRNLDCLIDVITRDVLYDVELTSKTYINYGLYAGSDIEYAYFPNAERVESGGFDSCSKLTTIEMPKASYFDAAFKFCSSLTTVILPNGQDFDYDVFGHCVSLLEISLPMATVLHNDTFNNCYSLSRVILASSIMCNMNNSNVFEYTPMSDSSYLGYFGSIYVPESLYSSYISAQEWSFYSERIVGSPSTIRSSAYQGSTILTAFFPFTESIGDSAFYNCSALTTADFPVCTTIGNYAFSGCFSLSTISLPVCSFIGYGAFKNCSALTTADFQACTNINDGTFSACSSLTTVDFPACTVIGKNAFNGCTSLTTVNLPACTTIGSSAFLHCDALTTVDFPACTTICNLAFYGCNDITTVDLPVCSYIGYDAFNLCRSLTSVNLPVCSVIGDGVFLSCTSLSKLILGSTSVCRLSANALRYTPMSDSSYLGYFGSIYVPASLVDAYKTADYWSYYSDRITAIE